MVMTLLDWLMFALLLVAGTLVALGVTFIYPPAGLITAGVILAVISLLFFQEAG